jgi:predicted nucleotidyltransferase
MAEPNPNLEILEIVASALGPICNEVVFVGGCAAGLLLTEVRAEAIRPTEDVDLVVHAITTQEYYQFERKIRARGFGNDLRKNAPICRWTYQQVRVDVMPTSDVVLGFANKWYPHAFKTASPFELPSGNPINLISAPCFIATKLEAFKSRGRDALGKPDFMGSHDLEDIISVLDRRPELLEECAKEEPTLRQYLAMEFRALLKQADFNTTLAGHLPGDSASQARLPKLQTILHFLSNLF